MSQRVINFALSTARATERACALAWPACAQRTLGGWWLRAAGGFTARANSALITGDPGVPVPGALAAVREFAAAHGQPPRLQVITGDPVEPALDAAGWRTDDDWCGPDGVAVLTGALPDLPTGPAHRVHHTPPADWWPLAAGTAAPSGAARHVLTGYRPAGFGITVLDGETVGVVRGAVVGDWLYVARLAVADTHRRRGLATGLLGALTRWGAAHGARRWVLQVTVSNAPATRLYTGMGCRESHRYRYWVPA